MQLKMTARTLAVLAAGAACVLAALAPAASASAAVVAAPAAAHNGPSVSAPREIPRSELPAALQHAAATPNLTPNSDYGECNGGPSESCRVYFIVSKGAFQTTYTYETSTSEHTLGPTGYQCKSTTCSEEQDGYPGSGGFSIEWEVLGYHANVTQIVDHY
jgi:hypothetical protein